MSDEYYSPGQLSVLYPYLEGLPEPRWLLLGGPGSANEAQSAVARWPGIRVVGVDPNPAVVTWQFAHGWPPGHPLEVAALWDREGTVVMADPGSDLLHARVHTACDGPLAVGVVPVVRATTWDVLDAKYGPFEDAVLWLDIEGSEPEALAGAEGLFSRGAVLAADVEMNDWDGAGGVARARHEAIEAFMGHHGLTPVRDWNAGPACRDRIYVARGGRR